MNHRMKRFIAVFIVCAAPICVTLSAGGAERSDFLKKNEAALFGPTPAQSTQDIFITDVELARDDGTGRAGQRVTNFRAKDNPLHCVVSLNKPREGVRVGFMWVAVDAGGERERVIADAEYVTKPGEARADGAASLPREWPKGRYRVQVTLNGRAVKTVEFSIG